MTFTDVMEISRCSFRIFQVWPCCSAESPAKFIVNRRTKFEIHNNQRKRKLFFGRYLFVAVMYVFTMFIEGTCVVKCSCAFWTLKRFFWSMDYFVANQIFFSDKLFRTWFALIFFVLFTTVATDVISEVFFPWEWFWAKCALITFRIFYMLLHMRCQ